MLEFTGILAKFTFKCDYKHLYLFILSEFLAPFLRVEGNAGTGKNTRIDTGGQRPGGATDTQKHTQHIVGMLMDVSVKVLQESN